MKSRDAANQVRNLLDYLANSALALTVTAVNDNNSRVTWPATGRSTGSAFRHPEPTVAEYSSWIRSEAYSAILLDGALIQLTYDFDAKGLSGHRLAYVPCPFAMEPELLLSEPILDLVEAYSKQGLDRVRLRSSIRFDYDPLSEKPGHSAAHLTINAMHCRIPCVSAVSLGHFVAFIFQRFYPEQWEAHGYLRQFPKRAITDRTIRAADEAALHIAWRDIL